MTTIHRVSEGPLARAMLRLALPEVGSQLLRWSFVTVDTWFIGRIGGSALAALSSASFVYWCIQALALLLSVGVVSWVARLTGAGADDEAKEAGTAGLLWALPYGIVVGLAVFLGGGWLMGLVSATPEATQQGSSFLQVIGCGVPFLFLGYVSDAAFRGRGDAKTPLILLGMASLLNILFDWIFVFWLSYGLWGAGLATALSQALAALVGVSLLWRRGLLAKPRLFSWLWRLAKVGAPMALSSLLFSMIYLMISAQLSPFGDAPIAGLSLGHRLEGLSFMIAVGFGSAATTLVGQALGAGKPERAVDAAWLCVKVASVPTIASSLVIWVFSSELASLFSTDAAIIVAGASYILLTAFSQLATTVEVVLEGAFGGAGYTVPPMLVSIFLTGLRIPLGFGLVALFGMGYLGIYLSIVVTAIVRGIMMAVLFSRGRWKQSGALSERAT